jgi:hypothetical protein
LASRRNASNGLDTGLTARYGMGTSG